MFLSRSRLLETCTLLGRAEVLVCMGCPILPTEPVTGVRTVMGNLELEVGAIGDWRGCFCGAEGTEWEAAGS